MVETMGFFYYLYVLCKFSPTFLHKLTSNIFLCEKALSLVKNKRAGYKGKIVFLYLTLLFFMSKSDDPPNFEIFVTKRSNYRDTYG